MNELKIKLLKSEEVAKILDVGYDTFRKVIKQQPKFPKPFYTHDKARPKWRDVDIDNYLRGKAA